MRAVALLVLGLAVAMPLPGIAQMRPAAPAPAPSPFHLRIDAAALAGLPRVTLSATDEGGHTATYGGVSLHDVIVRAGAPSGAAVRGKAMSAAILIGATDGYHAIFALPEIDPSFTDHVVLIADTRDGAPLGADGPYKLVVPFDKRQARWVKNVTDVSLVMVPLP